MMGASKRLELRIQSPFPDYTPAFDNHSEDYFADLCVFLHDRDATPLLLHRVLLSRTSRTFEALLHGKKGSSTATYNPTTRCVKGLPPCDAAIVSLLRFCYGAKLTVNKDNAVLVLVALAFMKLKQKHNEIRAQIRTLIKDITEHRVADGLAMVRQGEDYDKAFDTTFCVGASIARVVFPVINIETSLQALTDTLITLSPEYLDIVNYGSDKSQAHEAEIRLAYVRHNTTTLSYDEAKKIVSPLCISKLPIPTVMQLASLELCDTKELAAVIQGLYNENQVLKRKLAEAEKAKHELAKRLGDDESEDDDDEAESEENAVAFALAYERLRRLLHDSCIFHPSRVLHEQSETCHSDKRNGDKGIKEVCQALMADTETTDLDLSNCFLSDDDISLLDNNIQKLGVLALSNGLMINSTLTELNLGYNNVQDEGVKALARMLQENTSLKVLNLSGTIVSGECLNAMSDALSLNQTLTRLSFTYADRKSEAIRHFKEVLSEKKTPFLFTKL